MIQKKLSDVMKDDIKQLVDNQIPESKTLEYKSALPGNGDEDKREFLADVSSLANTDGGDLVFGVFEDKGVINKDFGIEIPNSDIEIQRLENLMRDCLDPRINTDLRVISVSDKKSVLVVRVKPSINSPHRVIFKDSNRFHKRNSNGKYEMDVSELKNAFGANEKLSDKIRVFRKKRFFDLKTNCGPVKLKNTKFFLMVHIIPFSGFIDPNKLSNRQLLDIKENSDKAKPMNDLGFNSRFNLDGVCVYAGGTSGSVSYNQVFRNGIIEGFDLRVVESGSQENAQGEKVLYMETLELKLINFIRQNLVLLSELEVDPPYFVFATIAGIEGRIIKNSRDFFESSEKIFEDDIFLPEVVINDFGDNVAELLKPIFDMIWNAAGFSQSPSYDNDGNFLKEGVYVWKNKDWNWLHGNLDCLCLSWWQR